MVWTGRQLQLRNIGGKEIIGTFNKGDISTEGVALLVERVGRQVVGIDRFSAAVTDPRDGNKVVHSVRQMLRQRVLAIAGAYEDCHDFRELAADGVLKRAVGRGPGTDPDLASQPPLSRLENLMAATDLYHMSETFVGVFGVIPVLDAIRGHHVATISLLHRRGRAQ